MQHTRPSPLRGALLYEAETERVAGTLYEHQDFLDDGHGGRIPGMKSWDCLVVPGSPLAAKSFNGAGELRLRLDDGREGKVFPSRLTGESTTLQGTGPLAKP